MNVFTIVKKWVFLSNGDESGRLNEPSKTLRSAAIQTEYRKRVLKALEESRKEMDSKASKGMLVLDLIQVCELAVSPLCVLTAHSRNRRKAGRSKRKKTFSQERRSPRRRNL